MPVVQTSSSEEPGLALLAIKASVLRLRSGAPDMGNRTQVLFPFPLLDPPPRSALRGLLLSVFGTTLVVLGMLGGGLAANGVVWSVIQLIFVLGGLRSQLPGRGLLLPVAIVAIPLGILSCVYGFSEGPRLRERGRRLQARDARTSLDWSKEEPVLLLRSFKDEQIPDPRPIDLWQRRYEESLTRVLSKVGPVVAIGRPGDDLSFGGAARLFVADAHWRQAVEYLMNCSRAVAIIVGHSEGLWWEIQTALKLLPRERLLFFFPYVDMGNNSTGRIAQWKGFFTRWNLTRQRYRSMEEERIQRYQTFRKRCTSFLDETLPHQLDTSLFLDFFPSGEARLLRARIRPWWHYLFPITGANIMVDLLVPRHRRRLRFDMRHTLKPFVVKAMSLRARRRGTN